jgi:hypothetical protein
MDGEMSIKKFIENATRGIDNVVDVIRETGEDGKEQTRVVLTQNVQTPVRMESPRRQHSFQDIQGLITYLKTYGSASSVILADAGSFTMSIVLNENAVNGFETLRFVPIIHPLIEPWIDVTTQWLPIDDFAQFIITNRRIVENGRSLSMLFSQVRASIKTEVQKGFGKKSINGVMTTIEVNSTQQTEPVELPEVIKVKCPIYSGTAEMEIEFDLVINGTPEGVMVLIGDSDYQVKKVQSFESFVKQVKDAGFMASLGVVSNDNRWSYVGGIK